MLISDKFHDSGCCSCNLLHHSRGGEARLSRPARSPASRQESAGIVTSVCLTSRRPQSHGSWSPTSSPKMSSNIRGHAGHRPSRTRLREIFGASECAALRVQSNKGSIAVLTTEILCMPRLRTGWNARVRFFQTNIELRNCPPDRTLSGRHSSVPGAIADRAGGEYRRLFLG